MAVLDKALRTVFLERALAIAVVLVLVPGLATVAVERWAHRSDITWTMVDVTAGTQQGDAHVIRTGRRVALIDAGTYDLGRSRLLPFLREQRIDRIDLVFVSHAHDDHFGGIRALVEAGVDIERVEISLPDGEVCRREHPWGCDEEEVRSLLALLRQERIPVAEPLAPMTWNLGNGTTLVLLERLQGDDPGLGRIDVNDTSMVLRLDVGRSSVLFTGDLNALLGGALSSRDLGLRSHVILKVPHHGAESLPPDSFFAAVDPDVALVPAPVELWRSDRCTRTRMWLEARRVPTFVSGAVGNVTVHLEGRFRVETERPSNR